MSWKKVRLPDVMFFQEGPGVRNTQFRARGIKLLNVGNINNSRINLNATKIYISEEEAYGKYKHFLVDEGDLVIASSGIVVDNFHNKIAFVEKDHLPLCMNTSTVRFKCLDKNETNINFFAYYLQTKHFKDQLRKLVTGSAQLNFGPSHLKQISFAIPPLPTQQHIAAILDKADALRHQNRQLLAHYDELLQSTFMEMFGDPVKNPKGWEVKKLGDLLVFMTSGSRGWAEYYSESGGLFLRIQNVGYNKLKLDDVAYVTAPETAEAKRTRVQPNDILVSITADLGRTAVIPSNLGEAYINQHLALLRLTTEINSVFVAQLLASDFGQRQFRSADKGGVKAGLNFNDIRSVSILLPPLSLQQHFAKIVEEIESQKQQAQATLAESEALFQGLLAGYFGEN